MSREYLKQVEGRKEKEKEEEKGKDDKKASESCKTYSMGSQGVLRFDRVDLRNQKVQIRLANFPDRRCRLDGTERTIGEVAEIRRHSSAPSGHDCTTHPVRNARRTAH